MRVGHLQPTRPEWFDRNPTVRILRVNNNLTGAQALSTDASYTVPTGKKAYVDCIMLEVFRTVDGTPNAFFHTDAIVVSGGLAAILAYARSSVSSYGPMGDQWVGQAGIIGPGDVVSIRSECTFADGTVNYNTSIKLTEFDA